MTPLAAGIDNAGEQGNPPGADRGTGSRTELAQDDPVTQGALGGIVGQRPVRVLQHLEDRLPIVEQLDRQGVSFAVIAALMLHTGGAQLGQRRGVLGG